MGYVHAWGMPHVVLQMVTDSVGLWIPEQHELAACVRGATPPPSQALTSIMSHLIYWWVVQALCGCDSKE
jgi:hypothetical protein